MSTDRELLELAAKAAGHEIDPIDAMHDPEDWAVWNPLNDDGDALRLAVRLGLRLTLPKYQRFGTTAEPQVETTPGHTVFRDDPMQQTREAIVNTAAEIGRAMP
jgi:hypothetical protein